MLHELFPCGYNTTCMTNLGNQYIVGVEFPNNIFTNVTNHISKNPENQNIGHIYAHRFFQVKSTMKGNTSLNQNLDCYRRL